MWNVYRKQHIPLWKNGIILQPFKSLTRFVLFCYKKNANQLRFIYFSINGLLRTVQVEECREQPISTTSNDLGASHIANGGSHLLLSNFTSNYYTSISKIKKNSIEAFKNFRLSTKVEIVSCKILLYKMSIFYFQQVSPFTMFKPCLPIYEE